MIPYDDALYAHKFIEENFGTRDDVLCVSIGHTRSNLAIFVTTPLGVEEIEDLPDNVGGVPIIIESVIEY